MEDFETAAEAALREVEEETGLSGVRMVGMPSPSLPAGFPDTRRLIPLPVWITEIEVPADNHLSEPHVHVDHMWVALAADSQPSALGAHPFGWYTCAEVRALPMFEDSRAVIPMLFGCIEELASGDAFRALSSLVVAAP